MQHISSWHAVSVDITSLNEIIPFHFMWCRTAVPFVLFCFSQSKDADTSWEDMASVWQKETKPDWGRLRDSTLFKLSFSFSQLSLHLALYLLALIGLTCSGTCGEGREAGGVGLGTEEGYSRWEIGEGGRSCRNREKNAWLAYPHSPISQSINQSRSSFITSRSHPANPHHTVDRPTQPNQSVRFQLHAQRPPCMVVGLVKSTFVPPGK